MKVLIIGANGKVGKRIVQEASRAGHEVHAMIRSEDQKSTMVELGGQPFLADLESDYSSAYEGMDVVIFTAGSGSKTGPEKTIDIDQLAAIKSMDIAREYGIKHYIMVSALGARDPENAAFIQHYFRAKKIADDYLVQSGVPYTIFRPGRLTDTPTSEMVTLSTDAVLSGPTSRAVLAKTIALSINNPVTINKIIEITDGDTSIIEALKLL
jgi:uncharacterized protein YbjT (DUF2867 family)